MEEKNNVVIVISDDEEEKDNAVAEPITKHRRVLNPEPQQPNLQSDCGVDENPQSFARNYQLEALEKAMRENTIVFLETGSGKTLIAIMLLRNYAHLLGKRLSSPSQHHYIAVFLVPTVVLVTQQARAVERHTDLKVGKLWGDLGVDFWDAATWEQQIHKHELLVMTHQILLDALRHSFLKLDMIKLLIFDECHHARGKHAYACIMTEFYHPLLRTQSNLVPRIFGMTASLINTKGSSSSNYGKQILELERLMNSKVYTVSHESDLAAYVPFATTKLRFYEHVDMPYALSFTLAGSLEQAKFKIVNSLKELQLDEKAEESALKKVSKLFGTFKYCLTDLGIWLAHKAADSLSCVETNHFFWGNNTDGNVERVMRTFSGDVFQAFSPHVLSDRHIGDSLTEDMDAGLLSAKVKCLIESLTAYRHIKALRCIIFVERVITSIVLQSLLNEVSELSCWKTAYMARNQSGLQIQSRKKQDAIIDDFHKGIVNIIVATQILEEGLDVQSCNLVIRFDPSATICSFIQSRGRARKHGSDYLLILKSGDASTLSKVKIHLAGGEIMREESIRYASLPCAPCEHEMEDNDFYRVEKTGALVTLNSSVALVYYYCSHLPSDGYFRPAPRFFFDKDGYYTLHLPMSCPIQTVSVQGQENMVKKIVCLEACRKLHNIGALTDNLLPESVVEEAEAQEFGSVPYEDKVVDYFPAQLVSHCESSCKELYHFYSIGLKQNFEYDVPLRDIILLMKCDSKSDFEDLDFQLAVTRGFVGVKIVHSGTIYLTISQVLMAKKFQLTLLRILLDHDLEKLKDVPAKKGTNPVIHYLLLPSVDYGQKESPSIDWDCVRSSFFQSPLVPWSGNVQGDISQLHSCSVSGCVCCLHTKDGVVSRSILENSLVYTPHNGKIYGITCILDDMDGNSVMDKRQVETLTYKKHFKTQYGVNLCYAKEPLLRGRQIFTVHNWLLRHKEFKEKEISKAWVELPPELCAVIMSPITIGTLYAFSLVPSIMHRVESILLARSLKKIHLDHFPNQYVVPTMKVLEAITTKKCQEEFSLESLETLGDSFLKYAVSRHLFRSNKNQHEGLLTIKKGRMISNEVLRMLGCDRKLQGFIRNVCFNPKEWAIPDDPTCCITLDETVISSEKIYIKGTRYMRSKVVADVVEALIGVYLSSCGEMAALHFIDWLGLKVACFNEHAQFQNVTTTPLIHPERHVNISHLDTLLNYSFKDPSLLVEALTHGSYHLSDIPRCYQRLEFLGDAVLDYLITVYMYDKYPGMSPGLLTDLRSASVNNDCYAHAAVKAGLHKHILHTSSKLHKQIGMFVCSYDQSSSESTFGWGSEGDLPKVLGDIIESLAGAILVDSHYDKDVVWASIKHLLEPLVTPETVKLHPVRELHELCQRNNFVCERSVSFDKGITSLTIQVKGERMSYCHTCTGANKKIAKKLASKAVLDYLKGQSTPVVVQCRVCAPLTRESR
ncbi:hypothetical protein MKX03_031011 [Papaver bracteatum]|nr:hypothetical protein MKX03_031011 [Papaver bracteatum]